MFSIFANNHLETMRFRDFNSSDKKPNIAIATAIKKTSFFGKMVNFAKNLLIGLIAVTQIFYSVLTLIELISIGALYLIPLLIVAVGSLISKTIRDAAAKVVNNIYSVLSNNVRIASLIFAAPMLFKVLRMLLGISSAPFAAISTVENSDFIQSAISVVLGIASTIISVFSDQMNTIMESVGLLKTTFKAEDTEENSSKKIWQIGGAIASIIASARLQPNLLFGIAAPSIVAGFGASLGSLFDAVNQNEPGVEYVGGNDDVSEILEAIAVEQDTQPGYGTHRNNTLPTPSAPPVPRAQPAAAPARTSTIYDYLPLDSSSYFMPPPTYYPPPVYSTIPNPILGYPFAAPAPVVNVYNNNNNHQSVGNVAVAASASTGTSANRYHAARAVPASTHFTTNTHAPSTAAAAAPDDSGEQVWRKQRAVHFPF